MVGKKNQPNKRCFHITTNYFARPFNWYHFYLVTLTFDLHIEKIRDYIFTGNYCVHTSILHLLCLSFSIITSIYRAKECDKRGDFFCFLFRLIIHKRYFLWILIGLASLGLLYIKKMYLQRHNFIPHSQHKNIIIATYVPCMKHC